MSTNSTPGDFVRRQASDRLRATPEDLARLRAGAQGPIDTSDIPESTGPINRVVRDPDGRLPQPIPSLRESPIRRAILDQLERRQMTRYQLWQTAKEYCPSLPSSAVYEYLRGQREIGTPYAEALMKAVGLVVVAEKADRSTSDMVTV
jgi:hypothetical protein